MTSEADASRGREHKTPLMPVIGILVGLTMALVPFIVTMVALARVSDVEGGFRGATKVEAKQEDVGFTLGSASLSALLVPPGLLMAVMSALTLAERRAARRGSPTPPES